MSLFRNEVIERQHRFYGDILLVTPTSITRLALIAAMVGMLIIAFSIFGEFTKKEKVSGVLLPKGGIIEVSAQQTGVIRQLQVTEGDAVVEGQPLYIISTDKSNPTEGRFRERVGELIQETILSIARQRDYKKQLTQDKQEQLVQEIKDLRHKQQTTEHLLVIKKRQLRLAEETLESLKNVEKTNVVSDIEVRERQSHYLALQAEVQELTLRMADLRAEISRKQSLKSELRHQLDLDMEQLNNRISDLKQKKISNKAMREYIVESPVDGVVSAINQRQGAVSAENPLLSIQPVGKEIQAHLFVSSRAIGFLQPGQEVFLRYEAFPYQKFGQYRGVISEISGTSIASDDLRYMPEVKNKSDRSKFVYRVKVNLDSQSVLVYNKEKPLRSGMILEASIPVESRKIYEWLLDPFKKMKEHI